jgi:GTP-binding protein
VLADLPGLIEGAHEGAGLGDRFLGHIERCRVLLHLVDGTADDVAAAYRVVRSEVASYDQRLLRRPELVCLNKAEALTAEVAAERAARLAAAAQSEVYVTSGVSHQGHAEVLHAAWREIQGARAELPA